MAIHVLNGNGRRGKPFASRPRSAAFRLRTVPHEAERMTLRNIPEAAYGHVVNGRNAIDWLIYCYRVTTDKRGGSGIVNDCNFYSDDPRYITELVERVVTVSMCTQEIVANLPALNERPQPDDWPAAWKMGA